MGVWEESSWVADCDECEWIEKDFGSEEAATQRLDDHIRETH
jgi:hypothetical protein